MENMKKYEYLSEQSEIREFSFYAILEQVKYHKGNFYVTGDNGQGAIVFFCTAEWAENFSETTGLELESYSVEC